MLYKHKFRVFAGDGPLDNSENLIVFKRKDKWNDFTFHTRYSCVIYMNSVLRHSLDIFVGVYDSKNKSTGLGNIMSGRDSMELSSSKENIRFFSMLRDINEYRSLVREFSVDEANEILDAMNDLVYLKENVKNIPDMDKSLYMNAIRTDVFKKSFIRNSTSFFSFRTSGKILRGLSFEELDRISNSIHMQFRMKGFNEAHKIDLNYNIKSILPKRINVLIGRNGLGKSQTLRHFVLLANDKKNYVQMTEQDFVFYDPKEKNRRPLINRVISFVMPGDGGDSFPDEEDIDNIDYKKIVLTKNHHEKKLNIGEELIALVRNENAIADMARWDIFLSAIEKIMPLMNICIHNMDGEPISLYSLSGKGLNEERKLLLWDSFQNSAEPYFNFDKQTYDLSSGQLAYFKFALEACQHIDNGTYVLIDEPETHMHPNYISDFMSLLDDILEKTGSLAIVATHSPYLVREVSRELVNVFRINKEEHFEILKPRLKTFGANISDISDFVFEDDLLNKLSDKILHKSKAEGLTYSELKKLYGDELPVEMLHYLKNSLEGDRDEKITTA
ncbi:AAA family ATPase [Pectobacterium aroidearum]|uniref:AAA family ATPase n=1 Tax=Pectobacterium aroidearum TaxID=1201031 RepID=UPI0033073DB4